MSTRLTNEMMTPGWKQRRPTAYNRNERIAAFRSLLIPSLRWILFRIEENGVSRRGATRGLTPLELRQKMEETNHPLNDGQYQYYDLDIMDSIFTLRFEHESGNDFRRVSLYVIDYTSSSVICKYNLVYRGHEFRYRSTEWYDGSRDLTYLLGRGLEDWEFYDDEEEEYDEEEEGDEEDEDEEGASEAEARRSFFASIMDDPSPYALDRIERMIMEEGIVTLDRNGLR